MVIEFNIESIGKRKESHKHGYGQFVLPLEGCIILYIEHKRQVLDGKSLGYIPPNTKHKYYSDKGVDALVINHGVQIVKDCDRETFENSSPFILDDKLMTIINIIIDDCRFKGQSGESINSLKYLFFYIYDKLSLTRSIKSVTYIHNNFQNDIPVQVLADLEHYNPNYFSSWFKKQIGLSPVSYIRRVRVEKTKSLLLTTNYNMTQIAMQTGYSQSSTMCKIFKEIEGCTPGEYRALNS